MTATATQPGLDLPAYCNQLAERANAAATQLNAASGVAKVKALHAVAERLLAAAEQIKSANAQDVEAAKAVGLAPAMLDRLKLDDKRIRAMVQAVHEIADQTDPVGQVIEGYVRPNGLR